MFICFFISTFAKKFSDMETIFDENDREEYLMRFGMHYCIDDINLDVFEKAMNKAIDRTLKDYTVKGKLIIEDWDMFEQDMLYFADEEFNKINEE